MRSHITRRAERREPRIIGRSYRKSRFTIDERSKIRKQVEETIKEMKANELVTNREFINDRKVSRQQ